MAGDHQQHRCEMGARTERVLPLQGREAPREGCAPGAGGSLGGMGPVWAREQPGLCTVVARAGRNTAHLQREGFWSEFWKWASRQEQ